MFDFTDWTSYFLQKLFFGITFYFIITGSIYYFFWIRFRDEFSSKKIQIDGIKKSQICREVFWSVITNIFSACILTILYYLQKNGFTRIYLNVDEYGWIYFFVSIIMVIFINDTYFYWIHFFMHKYRFLYSLHKVHHLSLNPNPITAQSQHPLEFIILSLFIPIVIFTIPIHPLAIFIFKIFSATFNIVGHLGYEFYPSGFTKKRYTKYILTSTHHNMHHEFQQCNYGLYFSFWDRIMKTHHKKYHDFFENISSRN